MAKLPYVISIVCVSLLAGCAVIDLHPYRFIEVGAKPLHWAAANGDNDQVRMLILRGDSVDLRADITRATPLHFAAWKAQYEIAELLIELGADVNATTDHGDTPLKYAAGMEAEGCQDADDEAPSPLGNEHLRVVALLIEHGADVNIKCSQGGTALQSAAGCNDTEIAQLLINQGADLDARETQWTALDMSVCRAPDIAILLINNGAKVNIRDPYSGLTPLHHAAKCDQQRVVEMLLQHGANAIVIDR